MVESLARVIAEHPFFEDMEKRHVQTLAGCAKNVRFEQGQVIFREGDAADEFYFIRKGLVAVEMMMPSGFVTVQTVGEGEMLGWSCFVPPYQWHFGTRTLQPVLALSFDGKCLRSKCNADYNLGFQLFRRLTNVVSQRLEATRSQLLDAYGDRSSLVK